MLWFKSKMSPGSLTFGAAARLEGVGHWVCGFEWYILVASSSSLCFLGAMH